MDIYVDVFAPKIIIPENCSRDKGFFIMDLGKAILTGSMNSKSGLVMNLNVTSVCAGLPMFARDVDTYRFLLTYLELMFCLALLSYYLSVIC